MTGLEAAGLSVLQAAGLLLAGAVADWAGVRVAVAALACSGAVAALACSGALAALWWARTLRPR
ncbi:MAG: hypothetical protein ACOH2F_03730 [Cellulomonas sp.]